MSQAAAMSVSDTHAAGSYITFHVGQAEYALSVRYVRYITARASLQTRSAPDRQGPPSTVFDFEGKSVVLHRLCNLVNSGSQLDESTELIDLLNSRRQDHINWIDALEYSIKTGERFEKATDPHKCAFGVWYDRYQPRDPELKKIMERFDGPHQRIHSLAENLLHQAHHLGELTQAIQALEAEKNSTLKELLVLFNEAISRLEEMIKPVVLVLQDGRRLFGLEVENIGDIRDFSPANWLAGQQAADAVVCYDGFFQSENKALFLNIVPHRLLSDQS